MEHKIKRIKKVIEKVDERIAELQKECEECKTLSEKKAVQMMLGSLVSYKSGMQFVLDILLEED